MIINDAAELPACLQEADKAGKIRTRTPKTEADYRAHYKSMATTLAGQLGEPHVEIYQVIDNLRGGAPIRRKPCGHASALKRANGRKLKRALKSGQTSQPVGWVELFARPICSPHV
jgi:hypothetical protein